MEYEEFKKEFKRVWAKKKRRKYGAVIIYLNNKTCFYADYYNTIQDYWDKNRKVYVPILLLFRNDVDIGEVNIKDIKRLE
ncbi:MAG: hypothetical protein ACP5M9_04370 [Candidatus Micrarchaeia archaeon]